MQPQFVHLRGAIYGNDKTAQLRFRQLVVNSVMATDIMDKDLKDLRNKRWENAFQEKSDEENPVDTANRKATIVIGHLIQASDVSHTMQHWHVYRKWNECLFMEMYEAYQSGRAEKNPADFWYQGEIGFFDFCKSQWSCLIYALDDSTGAHSHLAPSVDILPLAQKLKECGVFGVSSAELYNYAVSNRKEWEARGQEVVAQMVEKAAKMDKDN